MLADLSLTTFLTIILCALSSAILGNFILWKKISYFGDNLSHSTLFAFVIAYYFNFNNFWFLILFNFLFGFLVFFSNHKILSGIFVNRQKLFSIDTITMIFTYFFLSLAILLNENFNNNFEFEEFIFGDISTINSQQLYLILTLNLLIILFAYFNTRKFLLIIFNRELAKINNINIKLVEFIFASLIALLIAFAIKITGIFLITALLILPPACARIFSQNPHKMIFNSALISIFISIFAIYSSYFLSLSPAPTIIFLNVILLIILLLFQKFYAKT
ncbi:MAG: metal ABC transporter permease [Alphaproteobacteria bacterium]